MPNISFYKGYKIPTFNLKELFKVKKEDLLNTAGCLALDRGMKFTCHHVEMCTECLLVQKGWNGEGGEARQALVEFMVEHGYLDKSTALEIYLD